MKKKKIIIIVIIILFLLLAGCFILFKLGVFDRRSDCARIVDQISKLFETGNVYNYNEDSSKEYPFIEKYKIYTGETKSFGPGVVVIKYASSDEAEAKQQYIKDRYILLHSKIDNNILELSENASAYFKEEEDLVFTDGVYFIKIDSTYSSKFLELKEKILSIINKYSVKDSKNVSIDEINSFYSLEKNKLEEELTGEYNSIVKKITNNLKELINKLENCKDTECEKYLNDALKYNKYAELKDIVDTVQTKYDEVMKQKKDLVNQINSNLTKVEKSLSESDYENLKKQVNQINDSFYGDYVTGWKNRLSNIEEKVYKKSCKTYKYKDLLRYPDNYKGKKTYWFGVISQKVSKTQYRVGVNCHKYSYIKGYYCDDTIYVYYYGDKSLIEDDAIKMWGTMDGTTTYTAVLGNSITIPTFKAEYVEFK